eukprot:14403324-Ditylum_brightwellii.AAC.1
MTEKQKTQCMSYHRTFEGDGRMTRHVSIVLCSRADGAYCYPGDDENNFDEHGDIPPYIIYANKSKVKKDDKSKSSAYDEDKASANYVSGLYIYNEDYNTFSNTFGFRCKTTPKGSIQQDLFLDYAKFFVKHLPPDQGKGKTPAILILDSHKSRWSIE